MVDIADVPFSAVPDDEQARFLSKVRVKPGDWRGYKPRQFWVCTSISLFPREDGLTALGPEDLTLVSKHLENGVRDQIHNYASMFYRRSCCRI